MLLFFLMVVCFFVFLVVVYICYAFFLKNLKTEIQGRCTILGRFPIHTGPTPLFTPQTMLDACISSDFQLCMG